MKRIIITSFFVVAMLLLAAVSTAIANPADEWADKPTQEKTPGARATQASLDKETREAGKGKQKVNFTGLVEAVDAGSITLKLDDGTLKTCTIDTDTRIKILGSQEATTEDIPTGAKVHLQAKESDEGCLALKINAVPGKPEKKHHVGSVSAYEANASITIIAKDGTQATFMITEDTKILPEERLEELGVGSLVTIISPRDVSGGEWQAAGIVIHPQGAGAEEEPLEP